MAFEDDDFEVSKKGSANTAATKTKPADEDLDVDRDDQETMTMTDGRDRIQPSDKSKARVASLFVIAEVTRA